MMAVKCCGNAVARISEGIEVTVQCGECGFMVDISWEDDVLEVFKFWPDTGCMDLALEGFGC